MSKVEFGGGTSDRLSPDVLRIHATVLSVFQMRVTGYGSDTGDVLGQDAQWFIRLGPMDIMLPAGQVKPRFKEGDALDILIASPETMQSDK